MVLLICLALSRPVVLDVFIVRGMLWLHSAGINITLSAGP
jgi:hypothetical protein